MVAAVEMLRELTSTPRVGRYYIGCHICIRTAAESSVDAGLGIAELRDVVKRSGRDPAEYALHSRPIGGIHVRGYQRRGCRRQRISEKEGGRALLLFITLVPIRSM